MKNMDFFTFLVLVALFFSISLFGQNLPPPSNDEMKTFIPNGVIFTPDVVYRKGNDAWKLDLYMPENKSEIARPAIVFVHGGGFRLGDKRYRFQGHSPVNWYFDLLTDYAQAGYVAISINYCLSGEAAFPAAIEDVKTAIRWLRANAKDLNVDPSRIGAFGHSAGGELAGLAALLLPEAGLEGDGPYQEQSSAVQAVVVAALNTNNQRRSLGAMLYQYLVGPNETLVGLQKRDQEIQEIGKKASLISYVRPNAPPMLIIHGTDDFLPYSEVVNFVNAMRDKGNNKTVLMAFQGEGHAAFVNQFVLTKPSTRSFFDSTIGNTKD